MKKSSLLITLISIVIVFFIISVLQESITWPLILVLMIIGFLINLCISIVSNKKKTQ